MSSCNLKDIYYVVNLLKNKNKLIFRFIFLLLIYICLYVYKYVLNIYLLIISGLICKFCINIPKFVFIKNITLYLFNIFLILINKIFRKNYLKIS